MSRKMVKLNIFGESRIYVVISDIITKRIVKMCITSKLIKQETDGTLKLGTFKRV